MANGTEQKPYRGLTKEGNWVYGWYAKRCYAIGSSGPDMVVDVIIEIGSLIPIEVIPETVGQYTGLKDKRGKEIYEGDIIIFDNSDIGGKKYQGEVVWCDDQTLSRLEWGIWTKTGYLPTDFLGKLEVIGNIRESPELIEEPK